MLQKVAKRSAVGLRMELLNFGDNEANQHREHRLRLLQSFLDDSDLRDAKSSSKFDGFCAGFSYPKIEVRDFAALEIVELLGIKVKVDPDRTPEEWAKIRSQVREAVTRELRKTKQ